MKHNASIFISLAVLAALAGCGSSAITSEVQPQKQVVGKNSRRVIHVLVALCDNEHQGIVPVPAKIGNGDDPQNNLYW
ncbi:MAG TPA: hypothetical protein VLR90_20895, partial [Blastocatellia bacterium]|nr:hypothetical protein [Blastocatellia bacterium]